MKPQRVGRWREIGEGDHLVADDSADLAHLLVRQLEERLEQAKLVHHLQRRGVDRVAAEIAQEVRVLLQNDDIDAGAREQKAEHHAGGPAPGDDAVRGDGLHRHGYAPASATAGR